MRNIVSAPLSVAKLVIFAIIGSLLLSFVGIFMLVMFVFGSEKPAGAATNATGSCSSITVNSDDVKKATSDPSLMAHNHGLYNAPPQAIDAYICASALLADRLKAQPRLVGCKVPWQMLAAVGSFESNNGEGSSPPPYFTSNGDTLTPIRSKGAGAQGPMQITPLTWDANQSSTANKFNVDANGDGIKNVDNMYDSALGAAALICDRTPADYTSPDVLTNGQALTALQNYCEPPPYPDHDCQVANISQRLDLLQIIISVKISFTIDNSASGSGQDCKLSGNLSANIQTVIQFACHHRGDPYVGHGEGEIFHYPESYDAIPPGSEWYGSTLTLLALANSDATVKAAIEAQDGKQMWDCSGLTMVAYQQIGVNLPRSSDDQAKKGQHIDDILANGQPGDLVFFPGHVGMYLGNDQFIEAPHTAAPTDQQGNPDGEVKIATYSTYPGLHEGGSRYLDASGNPLPGV